MDGRVDWRRAGIIAGESFVKRNPDLLDEIEGSDPCNVLMESGINTAFDLGFTDPNEDSDEFVDGFICAALTRLGVDS